MPTCFRRFCPGLAGLLLLVVPVLASAQTSDCFNLQSFAPNGTSLDIAEATQNARATHWHPDGTMLFVVGRDTENVVGYAVDTSWTLHGATPVTVLDLSDTVGSTEEGAHAHGLFFRDDGEKLWVFNRTELWAYTLDTPWELDSVSSARHRSLSDVVRRGHDIDFHPDGTHLYIDDREAQAVYVMALSTPWDISTGRWHAALNIREQEQAVRGISFVANGSYLLLMDTARQDVLKYRLDTPYDLTTATFDSAMDVSAETNDPRGLSISADQQSFYVTGRDDQTIFHYTASGPCEP